MPGEGLARWMRSSQIHKTTDLRMDRYLWTSDEQLLRESEHSYFPRKNSGAAT
jgi:hypothetical protein